MSHFFIFYEFYENKRSFFCQKFFFENSQFSIAIFRLYNMFREFADAHSRNIEIRKKLIYQKTYASVLKPQVL
jgi:hypothetical protein